MSSAFNHGNSRPAPQPAAAQETPAQPTSPQPVGSRMLDQVLASTRGQSPAAGFVEPSDVDALRAVVEALRDQPFALEPVARELVHAMLEVQFRKAQIAPTTLRAMSLQLATTLCEDPSSRQRLADLWTALCER